MFDGVVRDLTDVRYVPQMKKSIISVGVVESKGLKVTMENDIVKITKRSMVVMKGARDINLYYLKNSTVTGVMTVSVDLDEDATDMWHMRLDHAGEKSMQALAKQGLLKDAKTYNLEFHENCVLSKKIKIKFDIAIYPYRWNS